MPRPEKDEGFIVADLVTTHTQHPARSAVGSESEQQAEDRRWRQVVHLFGFVGGERGNIDASFHTGTVAEVSTAVMGIAVQQGYEPRRKSTTRTLDGWLVAVEYEVPNKPPHEDMPMWHIFRRPADPWPTELRAALTHEETA